MSKAKIGILSLGCPRNLVDSENVLGRLNLKGHKIVDIEKADIGILNTCAFVKDAKAESIEAILDLVRLKKTSGLKKIIVYGCLVQRYKDVLRKEFPEVDAFVGRVSLSDERKRFGLTQKHFAYLKICEGCVNNCSYCVIPKIKGRFTSLSNDLVLAQVRSLDRQGISEINIIGQDITGYGLDIYGSLKLPQLLKRIIKNTSHALWLRLLYLHPKRVSADLLKIIRDEPKICKYIDLPIQHINNRILRLMNRQVTKKEILSLIDKIRKILPEAAIRTSVIIGFPSEKDKEFRELLDFIREVRFERLGAFIYSREEDTPAYGFKPQIPQKIKSERFNLVMSSQQIISEEINRGMLGKKIEVVIDEVDNDSYLGRSRFDAPEVDGLVYVRSKRKLKPGDFAKVKVIDTLEYDLIGEADHGDTDHGENHGDRKSWGQVP
ncbi:MAG: MiaB/RimO family radical SAM methylthiotransferase [Candidatus Omnitrophota bacterium]|nr:MiaB/RimO family radical SAM methylthiotransferase [Candidatus Omnitrophota bacterium]MBU1929554.1 MiaB/RimO family radical SAM methylthiotransferase [Candidatus Omnitrophota bacterium]MBU2035794.1 MiaB/RimO family radical SAM methylthiotransferase [Candidatus Omnitrophota bacterium]MBU2221653.1 MiaB/RimO family radical SAM methylthiotransferase [Candidatus Omnitrophota bacterium]